jgi:hypothetical protein
MAADCHFRMDACRFWVYYGHLTRPSSLLSRTNLHLFKDGIQLMEENYRHPTFCAHAKIYLF